MQPSTTFAELAYREGDDLAVFLLWRRGDNRLVVAVADARTGDEFELNARPETSSTTPSRMRRSGASTTASRPPLLAPAPRPSRHGSPSRARHRSRARP